MQGSLSILFDFGTSGKVAADWANQWKALAMHRQLANEIRIGHSQFTSSPTNMIKPLSSQSFENSALIDLFFIMDVKDMKMSLERSSFRRNFQRWVEANYGENSRTKTITQAKYNKICMYLLGQPGVDTDAKFRFWVKSKGFRITTAEDGQGYGNLFVPVKVPHTRSNEAMYPYDHQTGLRAQRIEYRRVAVAEEFFDVISAVHINERGIHVGQKKTYRAVASTYAFLPREAVSYYLMSCSTCKLRIQRCNSILLKHGRPVSPSLSYSDPVSQGECALLLNIGRKIGPQPS